MPQVTQLDRNIGRVLMQRFRLDEPVGSGSMGVVYRAWDLEMEQPCAVKLLHLGVARREAVVIRFCDEARIIANLYHPNIVELLDFGQEPDGSLFLAMEYLRGQDLHCLLQKESRLSLSRSLELIRQIGSAIHYVHLAGVIHRDIKPRNIILTQSPGDTSPRCAKVIDFGLSKVLDAESRGSDGLLIGTPEYLPPEAWSGYSGEVDTRADQWALAVLTYRLLSGRLPFEARDDTLALAHEIRTSTQRSLRDFIPEIPVHVDAAVARALSKDKVQRFASVSEFVRALNRLPLSPELCGRPAPLRLPDETLTVEATRPQRPAAEPPLSTQLALPLPAAPDTTVLPTLGVVSTPTREQQTRLTPQRVERPAERPTALRPLPVQRIQRPRAVAHAARYTAMLLCAGLLGWCTRGSLSASVASRQAPRSATSSVHPSPVPALPPGSQESPPLCFATPPAHSAAEGAHAPAQVAPARVFTKATRKRPVKSFPQKPAAERGPQRSPTGTVAGPPHEPG